MIISASRRTDIPAFYSEWMLARLKAGEVLVPYPRNPERLGRAGLSPDNTDCIMFWTKNPAPMLDKLDHIDSLGFRYYFSFTVTGYGNDIERNLPPKQEVIETFLRLSERIGPKRVDWRFDPVLVDSTYTVQWQLDTFGEMCRKLRGATERCIINFIKPYRHLPHIRELDIAVIRELAAGMAAIAKEHEVPIYNCTDVWDLRDLDISFSACIDRAKIEEICGYSIDVKKDPGQPAVCRCVQSIDIGMYDTCAHGCTYCYAIASRKRLEQNLAAHRPGARMLAGEPPPGAEIFDRTGPSHKTGQLEFMEY
ncbi:DUF1848 domain-containing protein [Brucepastera parasyntrophica]|uniref:DUF1848 domain-containing protein n=1 Tax=Brucepastera parasyntrophica TaxID=2880008 RepID=UPI00210AAAAC|nr:DUF1848 domain-containing protein [Brucepastera parasyntrophica]ULQ58514.1 DUF1848 domain-containing protein [Brucepastera parasyntrophica]